MNSQHLQEYQWLYEPAPMWRNYLSAKLHYYLEKVDIPMSTKHTWRNNEVWIDYQSTHWHIQTKARLHPTKELILNLSVSVTQKPQHQSSLVKTYHTFVSIEKSDLEGYFPTYQAILKKIIDCIQDYSYSLQTQSIDKESAECSVTSMLIA